LAPRSPVRRLGEQAVKDRLRANTEELMRRGGFGSPTMFVGGTDMFFGNDRLALVRAAVERSRKRPAAE
jgi:2-hydroxychromene-2-carboxylate isomerase